MVEPTKSRKMPVAALRDVLVEQFGYLLCHVGNCGIPDCPDCARFALAESLLLEPFEHQDSPPPWGFAARPRVKAAA